MSGLKVAWLSPWNHRSAIAKSASEVAFELDRRGHEVVVFRTEVGDALRLSTRPAPKQLHALVEHSARDVRDQFDVVVAHIGDHFGFHGALLTRLGELNAIGVFHDAFLANLAFNWLDGEEAPVRELTARTYGPDVWPMGQAYFHDLADMMQRRPMLEWLARQTIGAIAHAEHYAPRLRQACPGPVAVLPLAFTVPNPPPLPSHWNRITLAAIGHANANRRIDQLLRAVAASHVLRGNCRIKVIGEITDAERARLIQLGRSLGALPIAFTGWVTDDELVWQLRDVDVISCLRNPVLEGGSASLILAMSSARPTLVTDHGCYAEYPPGTLLKCSPDHEAVDVMRHLEKLMRDPGRFQKIGKDARDLVNRRHAPSAYADGLLDHMDEAMTRRPLSEASIRLTDTLISFGLPQNDPARARVQSVLASMVALPATLE